MEFQVIQEQAKKLAEQLQKFDQQLAELKSVVEALNDFKSVKPGADILVPLSSGIFVKAEVKESEFLRVNVGSNVSVKKSIPDTIKIVDDQIKEIEDYKTKLESNFAQMNTYAQNIQEELSTMVNVDEEIKKTEEAYNKKDKKACNKEKDKCCGGDCESKGE